MFIQKNSNDEQIFILAIQVSRTDVLYLTNDKTSEDETFYIGAMFSVDMHLHFIHGP